MKKIMVMLLMILFIPLFVKAIISGDINNDGKIGSTDYVLIRKHLLKQITLSKEQLTIADVNGDGKVNSTDYVSIRKIIINGVGVGTTPAPKKTYTVTFVGGDIIYTGFEGREVLIKGGKISEHRSDASKLHLQQDTTYAISFDYKTKNGTNQFDIDLYPDSLPQHNPTATTTAQHYDWIISSSSADINECQLRFFDDIDKGSGSDISIYNILMSKVEKIGYVEGIGLNFSPTISSRSGYIFDGWYTDPVGGTKVDLNNITDNVSLFAHWKGTYDHVIIIGVDGLGDTFRKDKRASEPNNKVNATNFYRIFDNYAYRNDVKSENITISAQNWTSIFTGVACETHGINNDLAGSSERSSNTAYPSIFYYVRRNNPNAKLTSYVNWNPINHGIIENDLNVDKKNIGNDEQLTNSVISYLNNNKNDIPKLLFVHLCDVDHAAHNTQGSCADCGGYSKNYYDHAQAADTQIGKMYDTIDSLGLMNNTLFIVVADHGETKGSHGTAPGPNRDPKEEAVVLAVRGYTVNKMTFSKDVHNRDVSAIVLYALGVDRPEQFISSVPVGLFNK